MYLQNRGYWNWMRKLHGTIEDGMKADTDTLIKNLSDTSAYVRRIGALGLECVAKNGDDLTRALPALVHALSDTRDVHISEAAARALLNAVMNEKSRDAALDALHDATTDSRERVVSCAAWVLSKAEEKGIRKEVMKPGADMCGELLTDKSFKGPKKAEQATHGVARRITR